MKKRLLYIITIFIFFGCAPAKKVSEGSYLLRKNNLSLKYSDDVKRSEKSVTSSMLENYIPTSQTPNKRILGAPLYLNAYNLIDSTKHGWFQRIFKKIGEAPIIYDSLTTISSCKEMKMFMQSNGFYYSSISDTTKYKRKKAFVDYKIKSGLPTLISSVKYNFIDKSLEDVIEVDSANSLIKVGVPLSRNILNKESTRIADYLKNMGYYGYSPNNINYLVDTLKEQRKAAITVNIRSSNSKSSDGSSDIYRIRNIYVNSDFSPIKTDSIKHDTSIYKGIYIINKRGTKQNIRPEVLTSVLTIYPNYIYSKEEIDYTNVNLSNLRFFKSVNIVFKEVANEDSEVIYFTKNTNETIEQINERYVDCTIECVPMKKQSYKIDGELSTNSNYTGISASIGYSNKNLFKGADVFNVSFNTAYDIMHSKSKKNSYEFGVSTSLSLPRLIVPFKIARYNRLNRVQTRIELSYNNQYRPYYHRMLSNAAFGYQWGKRFSNYVFKPLNVAYIHVPWIDKNFWEGIQNKYLQNSYTSQLIFGMAGSYNYSNGLSQKSLTHNLKINGETSGNFLNLMSVILDSPYKGDLSEGGDRYRNAFNVRYSEYFRFDLSYVLNQKIKENGAIVFRIYAGGGYAYNNTKAIPFERMFFVGGASSMRGWQVRTLGPGASPSIINNDYAAQVGNIRLEANLEGRFHVAGPLNGAIFLDCGNVWMNGKGDIPKSQQFRFNTFTKQIALNTGMGARFDFKFFILRLDWGIILRNPGWEAGHEWIRSFSLRNTAVHFGIGYPF